MGQVSLFRSEKRDGFKCFLNGHVSLVILFTERIDDQDVETSEQFYRLRGNPLHVWEVGDALGASLIEAESMGEDLSVIDFDRGDLERVELEWTIENPRIRAHVSPLLSFIEEGPGKHLLENSECFTRAIHWKGGFTSPAKGTELIEARDVIKMAVGVKNRVDLGEPLSECLLSQVGSGIDEDFSKGPMQEDGAS